MKEFMEFLLSPGGLLTLVLSSVVAFLKRGTWIPWLKSWAGKAIPGDTALEKLTLDQLEAFLKTQLDGDRLDAVVASIIAALKARGFEDAGSLQLQEIPLTVLKQEYQQELARTQTRFGLKPEAAK